MKLDLRPLLRGEVSRMPVSFTFPFNDIDGVTVNGDVKVSGEIVDNAGYMRMTLEISFDYTGECARCLDQVNGSFSTGFERTVVDEGTLTDEQLENNVDEYAVIGNGFLDVDEQLAEEILYDFPRRLLCSEDCPGLCPKCGKKLSEGDCGCEKSEPDPRWAVLREYSEKLKKEENKYKD